MIRLSLTKQSKDISLNIDDIKILANRNYELLDNKPSINNVELVGNKSFEDLGIVEITSDEIVSWWSRI